MKVLVATSKGQGQRKNDFAWATEGELVGFTFECDGERVDGPCGCRRSFSGIDSRKATTTALVAECLDMTPEQFIEKVCASEAAAWHMDASEFVADARELLKIAAAFPLGMVVEKRGNNIQERRV